jgi:predicted amidophosphoribosyltransferase
MQGDLVKLCPQCGSEYQMWVERCLDCDAALVHGREGQGLDIRPEGLTVEEAPAIPPGCVHLRTAPVDWIRRLSEDLDEAGIRHWTTPPAWRLDPGLYVLPDDHEAAARVDRARYAVEVPEVALEEARPQRPVRRREPSDDLDVKVCPSCGAEYQLWAETCADCGVPLVRPWDLESARESEPQAAAPSLAPPSDESGGCPACGEPLPEGVDECPGCGLTLAQPETCPNCGAELNPHASGCRRCGFQLFETMES